jgi:hypothetical protein
MKITRIGNTLKVDCDSTSEIMTAYLALVAKAQETSLALALDTPAHEATLLHLEHLASLEADHRSVLTRIVEPAGCCKGRLH